MRRFLRIAGTITLLLGSIAALVASTTDIFQKIRPFWHPDITGVWTCAEHCQPTTPGYVPSVRYERGEYVFRNEVGLESKGWYKGDHVFLVHWPSGDATAKLIGNEIRWSSENTVWKR